MRPGIIFKVRIHSQMQGAVIEWSRFFKLFNRFTVIVLTQQVEVSRRKM